MSDINKQDFILYIIVRTDLPSMNPGKGMAQASHAANSFIKNFAKEENVKAWASQTNQGFGTVIVLAANLEQLTTAVEAANISDTVIDPTYPYIVSAEVASLIDNNRHTVPPIPKADGTVVCHRSEVTCGYVFGTKERCKDAVGKLPLHA